MLQFSYNNIIIIPTIVVTLEFLSSQFVHPDPPQLNILTFLRELEVVRITKANNLLNLAFLNESFLLKYFFL